MKIKTAYFSMLGLLASVSALAGPANDLLQANFNKVVVLKNVSTGGSCAAKGIEVFEGDTRYLALQVNYEGSTVGQGNQYYRDYDLNKRLFRDSLRYSEHNFDFVFHNPSPSIEVIVDYNGAQITRITKKMNDRLVADCQ